jgi:FtsP/CotA-like multicopper oxidase with cupredoxin domain
VSPRIWTERRRCSRRVEPGGTFEYRFVVPDAGTFWYHSHVNETEQLERGLYGALIVRGPDEPTLDAERVLLLDDLKLGPDGDLAPFGDEHELHAGREGDVRLVNGRQEPELEIAAGQIERWRIVNAANTRFVRLSIGARPFSILGTDGGLLPTALQTTEVLITPGERVDLAVGPFAEGEVLEIEALPYDRGKGERPRERFATVRVGAAAPSRAEIPDSLRRIEPLVPDRAEPTRTLSMKALMHGGQHQRDEPVRVGELQVWDLVNETSQDHPFHLHGFFVQIVEQNGERPPVLSWKDTVNVGSGQDCLATRRSSGRVDVPLPHPRTPRDGDDGALQAYPFRPLTEPHEVTHDGRSQNATRRGASLAIAEGLW